MAFVLGFEHDVFVSYAHRDDDPPPREDAGWVTLFGQALRKTLSQKLDGRAPDVWMDHRLAENAQLGPELQAQLQRSAVLLIVLSPPYLASEWCQKERQGFMSVAGGRAASSVFVIEKDRVRDRPPELSNFVGRRFWKEDPNDADTTCTLGWPVPEPDDDAYWSLINSLASKLAIYLQELGSKKPEPAHPPQRPAALLAQATDDLFDESVQVREYLEQAGIEVLPKGEYPGEPEAMRAVVRECLPRCRLFVQLLGPKPGRRSEAWPLGMPGLQYDVAQQSGVRILQWRDPRLEVASVANEAYRSFLNGANVTASGLEEFKSSVVREAQSEPKSPQANGGRLVVIDALAEDASVAQELGSWLSSQQLDVIQWVDQKGGSDDVQRFADMLSVSNGFVVVCGDRTDQRWFYRQVQQGRKYGAQHVPQTALAVYDRLSPEQNTTFSFPGLRYLNCRRGLDEQVLRQFVDNLAQ